ncbi:hypothetical protein [Enterococcus faecalis]|uniref:hypothetical protein n=1 Tax=Enterococcus faecalis TaxID=1351 RepID=UPI000667ABBE|nr:hypothetical protein [Enterococcus faecalis]MDU7414492.1 hypothetical protein [Varibaculum cambriense]MDT2124425.1 hypothetical protein [Enterococcus faecalis]MDU1318602.1 hypothetical protein [Enterococcus faecalis]NRC73308.1 hypothetical protein [Enterococcus faecalis]HBI1869708.1 hypothetical protein [Enterococcus faecalis]
MKCYLSNITNKEKPDQYKVKKISNTILNNLRQMTIQEFAEELSVNGKTVVLAELSENKLSKMTPIVGQEVVMLDFDNKDENNLYTIEDLEADSFMQENASFIYRTFSDLFSEVDKFRVVFHLDKLVTENQEIEQIYQALFKKYPQADSSVGQTSRLFFGSNSGYEVIDWDNVLDTNSLLIDSEVVDSNSLEVVSGEMLNENTPIYLLLKYKRYDLVKQKLGNEHSNIFPDDITASNYFKTRDMREFLEISDENPFYDIFHEEDNPSASVYFAKDIQIYMYKCFSESNPFHGDIVKVLKEYLGFRSFSEVMDLLIEVTNSEISYLSEIGQAKRDYNDLRDQLRYKQLKNNYPEVYSYLNRYEDEVIEIMDIMFDFTYLDKTTGKLQYLNYLSLDRITKYVNDRLHKKNSKTKISNIMNLIIVMEMVTKLPPSELPKELKEQLIDKQQSDSQQIRTSNVYKPSIDLAHVYEIAKKLKRNNVTINSLGFEVVYRLFGLEKAKQDFPQAYSPLEDRNLIVMSEKDSNLPKKNVDFENLVVKILFRELKKKGYIFEETLILLVTEKLKNIESKKKNKVNGSKIKKSISEQSTKQQYVKVRADIINKYDLSRHRNNVETNTLLKVKGKFSSKVIIYKNN